MKYYRAIIRGHCQWRCPECTCQDGKGWSTGLGNKWRLRNVYSYTEPKWVLQLEREWNLIMAKTNFRKSSLLQIPLAVYANDLRPTIHIRRVLRNSFSEWYWRVVSLDSVFYVAYTNKCRQKSSTHLRQWCPAFFAYQDWQLGRHTALAIYIVSEK